MPCYSGHVLTMCCYKDEVYNIEPWILYWSDDVKTFLANIFLLIILLNLSGAGYYSSKTTIYLFHLTHKPCFHEFKLYTEIQHQFKFAPVRAFRNCLTRRYFTSRWRGIGFSFQLAITAPLYSIIGYCIATAQSWK